ncbi:hypothetical protein Tco_1099870 [Tanacetum coccineum]
MAVKPGAMVPANPFLWRTTPLLTPWVLGWKNVNNNGNKNKYVEPTIEVSNSNPFDMLNSVENDVDLGTNGGSPNMTSSKANTSGFLSGKVESSSTSNTFMVENFDKMERLIIEGNVILVDDKGKPLKKVDY